MLTEFRLATNLYREKTRFVFELIQNAEDNKYSEGREPFLTFALHPDKIVVDSNEDGFEEHDVRSICRTGASTKKERGYIGEKGLGFKSVFNIASNVHIQSGPFSFCFEHERGDDGLGMVTPIYKAHDNSLPSNIRTRMTLRLAASANVERLMQELSELPDSLVMFLTKIKKLSVETHVPGRPSSKVTYSYIAEHRAQGGTLTKLLEIGDHSTQTTQDYHVTKRVLKDLRKDPARPNTDEVEVVLAFPLAIDSVPIIEQQYVFAYLPVRQVGYSVSLANPSHNIS